MPPIMKDKKVSWNVKSFTTNKLLLNSIMSIPYIEYTKLEKSGNTYNDKWFYMSHLSNACASEDAHRTSAYAICLLKDGEIQLETDLFVQTAKAPAIFSIAPSAIRQFIDLGTPYDAQIIFFRKEKFLKNHADINYLEKFNFFGNEGQQAIPLDENQFDLFNTYFDLIRAKTADKTVSQPQVIRSLIDIILNEIEAAHKKQSIENPVTVDRNTAVLSEFKALLAKHFIEERQVSFYAEKLHLTPKYFSTIIREVSGKTAGSWINEMLVLESKVRLQNPQFTVAQIAYDLNFSDPSHFGRFFKKHVGLTPLEYRN